MTACEAGKPEWGDEDLKMQVVTTAFHLVFPFLKMDKRTSFLIMAASSLYVSSVVT